MADLHEKYPEVVFDYNASDNALRNSLQSFRGIGSVGKRNESGRLSKCTPGNIIQRHVIDGNPNTSIMAQKTSLSYGICQTF